MKTRMMQQMAMAVVMSMTVSAERVLVVDSANNRVLAFTSSSVAPWTFESVVVPAGTYGGGALASLFGLAVHGDRMFVVEAKAAGRVLEFSTGGEFRKVVHTFGSGTIPRMATFGPDGYLYVADAFGTTAGDCIWKVDVNRNSASLFISQAAGALANPHGMAFAPDGYLYVADRDTAGAGSGSGRIKRFSSGGVLLNGNVGTMAQPMGLEWDGVNQRLLVGAGWGGVVRSITLGGAQTQLVDDVNTAFMSFAMVDGQAYGVRVGKVGTTSAGICRITGASPSPLMTGTQLDAGAGQMAVVPVDADGDGLPDPWEIRYFLVEGEDPVADAAVILARQDAAGDADGDGLTNRVEFYALTHPKEVDSDRDGLSDGVESGTGVWVSAADTGTDPLRPDSDGDGLLDGQESRSGVFVGLADTGTSPLVADTDGDGAADYLEVGRGSDPCVGSSTPGGAAAGAVVDLKASGLSDGPLSTWANAGVLGGGFQADFEPTVETIGGVKGVTLGGFEVMTGPAAPPNLTGGSARTIEAWIYNPSTSTEETIVSWGRRDGPNGTLSAFFHGTNANFGAVGNWGTPDMAWGPDAERIAANVKLGAWTYVVYTYDGGGTNVGTVYSNGSLANTEALGVLSTFAVDNTRAARPLPIRVGGHNAADGSLSAAGQKGSLTIARLRIHDRLVPGSELGFNDTDGDGMKDWYEDFYGLDKAVNDAAADTDGDGLDNLAEQAAGTNPSLGDTDGDGMPDGWEFSNFGGQAAFPDGDADEDGATNLQEYQAGTVMVIARGVDGEVTGTTLSTGSSNPNDANSQPETDGDGLPDGWERKYLNDLSYGAGQDSDADGFDNVTEFLAGSDPGDELSVPSDTDADGLPDAWERTHFGGIAAQNGGGDPDGDRATNEMEETGGSDPNDAQSQPDSDKDGMLDGYEMTWFGTLDQDGSTDVDGDGFSDLAEYTAGSNPLRPGNTPANVNDTVRVAVGTSGSLDEYEVKNNVWTRVRVISAGLIDSVVFHQGMFYATAGVNIVRIDPVTGVRTILATQNTGSAAAAGWLAGTGRDLCVGPDGKLYFGTSFGGTNGEGIFRLGLDGSGFERFIARAGGTAPATWDLFNCIGLAWDGDILYAAARGAFDATGRPVYKFDATGAFLGVVASSLQGPQGLLVDGKQLVVTGTNAARALVGLDLTAELPTVPVYTKTGVATNPDAELILGEIHVVAYQGSILKAGVGNALTTVLPFLGGGNGADLTVFTAPAHTGTATVAEWKLNETSGTVAAATGNPSVNGVLGNVAASTVPVFAPTEGIGGAVLFDEPTDQVKMPALNVGERFTVMGWIKPADTGTDWARFVTSSYTNGFYLGKDGSNNQWTFLLQNDMTNRPVGGTLVAGEWQHVCGTYDGTTARLYVNGVEVGSAAVVPPALPTQAVFIGPEGGGFTGFAGLHDEVRILDGALDAAAVAGIYASENNSRGGYNGWAAGFGFDGTTGDGLPTADKDRDGSSNEVEYRLGLNPVDASSRFAAAVSGGGSAGVTLSWPSKAGVSFVIKSSTNLVDWVVVGDPVPAAEAPATRTSWSSGPLTPGGGRFFRVELQP